VNKSLNLMPGKLQKPRPGKLGGNNDKSSSKHIPKTPGFINDKIEQPYFRQDFFKLRYAWNKWVHCITTNECD
jgi:hypothetical protein